MAEVSAVIVIYDIRGFTAASRNLPTADLGAFAVAAHGVILRCFEARPADFVKNLGDGHMLIWETAPDPDPELVRYVYEASASARQAFPAFVADHLQAEGLSAQACPSRIGFGITVGTVSKSDDYYGRQVNLAARLQDMARPEGVALSERAFALAGDRTALQKRGFRLSTCRLKGLGAVPVWTDRPFSWARTSARVARVMGVVLLPVLYVLLADADPKDRLPGGQAIQSWLDGRQMSLFRPIHSDGEVRAAAQRIRKAIVLSRVTLRLPDGRIATSLQKRKSEGTSVWGSSQAISGLLTVPDLSAAEKRKLLLPYVDWLFREGEFIPGYGWRVLPDRDYTLAEPACWTVVMLARALATPGILTPGERGLYLDRLSRAQAATAIYRPLPTGGWNIFPNQKDPERYSPYSTTLGLLALLETHSAGLPWAGRIEERDALLKRTAQFLIAKFTRRGDATGWQRTYDAAEPISEGMTLQLVAQLMRAQKQAGIPLPREIPAAVPQLLELASGHPPDQPDDSGEFIETFTSHAGRELPGTESINFPWHSWAVEAAMRWLERSREIPTPQEEVVSVRRSLGVLVVDMERARIKTAAEGWSYIGGETLFNFSTVPAP